MERGALAQGTVHALSWGVGASALWQGVRCVSRRPREAPKKDHEGFNGNDCSLCQRREALGVST